MWNILYVFPFERAKRLEVYPQKKIGFTLLSVDWLICSCISVSWYALLLPGLGTQCDHNPRQGRSRGLGWAEGEYYLIHCWAGLSYWLTYGAEKTQLMVLFQNTSVFQALKGKPDLRESQRQAEKRSSHRRSGTTKRFPAECGSLFIEGCRKLGKGIKGNYLFTSPSYWCGLHLWVYSEKIKRRESWEWGESCGTAGTDVTEECHSHTDITLWWMEYEMAGVPGNCSPSSYQGLIGAGLGTGVASFSYLGVAGGWGVNSEPSTDWETRGDTANFGHVVFLFSAELLFSRPCHKDMFTELWVLNETLHCLFIYQFNYFVGRG